MPYDPTVDEPNLASCAVGGHGQTFNYISDDAAAAVTAAGYFSDGVARGLTVGSRIECMERGGGAFTVVVTAANADGSVDCAAEG